MATKRVVIIDGARTPFLRSGGPYIDLMSYELGQLAIKGLLEKTGIDPKVVDYVVYGNVISNIKTENVAREAAVTAGIPTSTPCHTVKMACISANQAIAAAAEKIMAGQADVVIAGGVDNTSDTPIGFRKEMRKKLFLNQKMSKPAEYLSFVRSLELKDITPEKPAVAEFLTGRTMGKDCEILAQTYGVTRQEQDEFTVRSHQLAGKAYEAGYLQDEIVTVQLPPKFSPIERDNGVRPDTTLEKISQLKPAFDKVAGTITAANASFLTDGASAILLMSEEKAKELGLTPKAAIVDYTFTGADLYEELLLGPTYSTSKVLKRANMKLEDMDVIEFHEAFAGQILANIKCLASNQFAKEKLGRDKAVGQMPMEKFNTWGGSLSLGHPFGATGARLVTTAANRLIKEKGKYALIAACAAGAHGHAMIIERYN